MQYGILVLIALLAIISTGVFCYKTNNSINLRVWFFFCSGLCLVISGMKGYLEGARLSLIQSFWEANINTYIHYGIPLLAIAVIMPIIIRLVLRERAISFIEWHSSIFIIAILVAQLLCGKISNILYIVIFFVTFVAAFVASVIAKKGLCFANKSEIIGLIKNNWSILLLPAFLIFFYYPNELYFTNMDEFSNTLVSFELILILGMVLCTLILSLLVDILPSKWINKVVATIFALSLAGYLQAMFLNGKLGNMIGVHQQWDILKFVVNAVIWICVIVASLVLCTIVKNYNIYISRISLFLIALLSITAITLFIQNISSINSDVVELTTEGDLILGRENNVLVFVLDKYDTRLVDEIEKNNPLFFEPLHDFTLYDETTARHSYTAISIPYLLTASQWAETEEPFMEYAYNGDTFISELNTNGIDIGVYTSKAYFNEVAYDMARNARSGIKEKSDVINTLTVMGKASLYKVMPFVCKENYFYYTGDISEMVKYDNVWTIDNDVPFYERIKTKGVSIDNDCPRAFRFYHMRGAHYPFYLSDDIKIDGTLTQASELSQARGSMKIVYAYIEELQRLGVYDDTTIIITSDHGEIVSYDEKSKMLSDVSMPILFVKKANQHGEKFSRNHAMVSHKELFSTILDGYGLDYTKYGLRLEDIDEHEERERYFGYSSNYEGVVKGTIIGTGREVENWHVD